MARKKILEEKFDENLPNSSESSESNELLIDNLKKSLGDISNILKKRDSPSFVKDDLSKKRHQILSKLISGSEDGSFVERFLKIHQLKKFLKK